MSLISSVKLLLRFDDDSLLDEVSGNQLSVLGDSNIEVESNGLLLKRDQDIFTSSASLGITTKMSMGFWLNSSNPGLARNPITGQVESMNMPILDFGVGDISPYTGELEIETQSFMVYQQALDDGKLRLVAVLSNSLGATFTAKTTSYDPDINHYFWIAWDGGASEFKIFVDGVEDIISTTGTVLGSIEGSFVAFSINRLALGASYNSLKAEGIIDDIIVLNDVFSATSTIQKVINYNVDFAFDTNFMDILEVDYGLFYNDINPISVTDSFDDGVFFFVTRNDGKILRGTPVLWEVRRDFSNDNENDVLNSFGEGVKIVDGELQITKGTIRL